MQRQQQHPCDNKLATTTNVNQPRITAPQKLLSFSNPHTHTYTSTQAHTHILHQLGPLASGSPQWNFHAAIWRSIGDRDLLSGLHVPLEKTRKPEHIGFCKSEEEERGERRSEKRGGENISTELLDFTNATGEKENSWHKWSLLSYVWVWVCMCRRCLRVQADVHVQYLCQSSAKQVWEENRASVDPHSLSWFCGGNRGNGAQSL